MAQPAKRNLVIFVGAGFSAPFGIPVMRAFSDQLRDRKFLSAPDQLEFDNIQLTCDNMGALIGSSSRNLEQLSSFLAVQNINDPGFTYAGNNKYKTPADALKLVKRCIFELIKPDLTGHDVSQHTALFDEALHDQFHVTFVTTNYDLVLEIGCLNRGNGLYPTEMILAANDQGRGSSLYSRNEASPHLFKLHGSVNWFKKGNGDFRVVGGPVGTPVGTGMYLKQWLQRQDGHSYEPSDCVIVPPSVIKPQIDDALGEQWRGATEAIKKADAVWFVGYSFPESDSFMRYFVASAFATNTRIRQLVVIDPDMSVKKRCLSIFRAERLKDVFTFIPLKWQDIRYTDLANGNIDAAVAALKFDKLDSTSRLRGILWPE